MSAADLADAIEGVIGSNDEHQEVKIFLDTGYMPLNRDISGSYDGGMPVGRIVEMFGPPSSGKTAIATKVMIAAQQAGGVAAFMDHERSFDVGLAAGFGLDVTKGRWVFKTPETFQESVDYAKKLMQVIRTKELIDEDAPIVIVFDSLASMVPQSILVDSKGKERDAADRNMNDNTALARATSAYFPALAMLAEKYNALLLFLNQARTKIGVMYGDCFEYHAPVTLADGSVEWIGKIVNNRMPVEVLTVNEKTGAVEAKRVINWSRKSMDENWLHLRFEGGANGRRGFKCTPNHSIFTPDGEKKAKDLKVGDLVTVVDDRFYTEEQHEVLLGSILGDGGLRFEKVSPRGHVRFTHGKKQRDYLAWKCEALGMELKECNGHVWASSHRSQEFARYAGIQKSKAVLEIPDDLIAKIGARAAAIWYLDDGSYVGTKKYGAGKCSIAAKMLSAATLDKLAQHFDSIGLGLPHVREGKGLTWTGEEARKFMEGIAPFVPDCMGYKLNHWITPLGRMPEKMAPRREVYANKLIDKWEVEPESRWRFDMEVEGNHNYLVNGVLVHNSTTTPGGVSPEFYSSVRIKLGRTMLTSGQGKDRQTVGQAIGSECVKNKVSRPFQKSKWNFMFREDGSGFFDVIGSTIEHAIDEGILKTSGPRVEWTDGKSYFKSQLAKRIEDEGLEEELFGLLRKHEAKLRGKETA